MGQMLLEGDILALPSVKFYGAVETLCIVVAIGCGFEEEAGAGELYGLDSGIMVRKEQDILLHQKATRVATIRSRLVSSFDSRRVFL